MTTSSHDDLRAALTDFALGVLDGDERVRLSAHLASCAECQGELAEIRRALAGVGASIEPVEPPASLRNRVVERAREASPPIERHDRPAIIAPPRRWSWLPIAASLIVAAAATIYAVSLRSQVASLRLMVADASARAADLRAELNEVRQEAATLTRAVDVLRAPDLLRVDLKGQAGAEGASGRAFWSRTGGILFSASGLPARDRGRVYQLWTITGTTATSAGVMSVDPRGTISHTAAASASPPDAFGVTIEPAGGSPAPTLPIVMIGTTR